MQLQAVAANNKRLLGDITSLHKASPLEAGLGIIETCEVNSSCQTSKVESEHLPLDHSQAIHSEPEALVGKQLLKLELDTVSTQRLV